MRDDATGTWYVVKYMEDLKRREPRNVGVALLGPEGWDLRFFAEGEPGEVDGRAARRLQLKKPVYEAWVDYYRRSLTNEGGSGPEVVLKEQTRRRRNFFLELGGRVLEVESSWPNELDTLYRSMVSDPTLKASEDGFDLKHAVDEVFRQAGINPQRSVELAAPYRSGGASAPIKFDYQYVNGQTHLMDAVSLASPNALALAQSFESRTAAIRNAHLANHFVAFVSTAHAKHSLDDVMPPLEAVADVVDVDSEDAASKLRTLVS